MSVQSEIDRITQNVADTYAAAAALGADMPETQNSGNLARTVGTAKAVLYAEQALTSEQRVQARKNIGLSMVSVTDYGAKGDGSTDDTAAFQTALAENRVVFVPGGTYKLSDNLVIRENCELELSQDTVLNFTQTGKNCITMLRIASLRGNHATVFVPYTFSANVINADTAEDEAVLDQDNLANSNAAAVPPFKKWDPQWKLSRYVTDINICKPNSNGFHYSDNGTCYGTAVYMGCSEGVADYMWGVNMSGLRIAGGFAYGIHLKCEGETWNHDGRIEAVMDACETAVFVDNTHFTRLAVTVQPRSAADGTKYAKHGIKIANSRGIDLSSSRVWDWNATNTRWTDGGEYQHIAMYGQCRGLILDDYLYHEMSGYDIRSLIYTDTASNLEQMTILQEPITRWFKPVDGVPYFSSGNFDKKLMTQEDVDVYFDTDTVKGFTDVLSAATDTDGVTVFNGIGYQKGMRFTNWGKESGITASSYYMVTGFIEMALGETLYCKDLKFAHTDQSYSCIAFYNENREWVANINIGNIAGNKATAYTSDYAETEDGCSFKISASATLGNLNPKYIRICFPAVDVGVNPMIAINEEIKYTVEGFLADGVKVKAENVIGNLPGGGTVTDEQIAGVVEDYFEEHPIEIPDSSGAAIDVTAGVGQTIVVEEVDETGRPTKWRAADFQERTHYETPAKFAEATLTNLDEAEGVLMLAEEIQVGKTYTVIWNGAEYVCIAVDGASLGEPDYCILGNIEALMGTGDTGDTGEPFVMVCLTDNGDPVALVIPLDDVAEVTVEIHGTITTPIPVQYLTNALPYTITLNVASMANPIIYSCNETVEYIRNVIYSGRDIRVKAATDEANTRYIYYNLLIVVDSLETGLIIGFTQNAVYGSGSNMYVTMQSQEDGTFTANSRTPFAD